MNKNRIVRIVFLVFFFIIFIISIIKIINWNVENNKINNIIQKEEDKIIESNGKKYLDESIKKDNEDTIGWLIVDGTNINYPVVQYSDNLYYLSHDFYNQDNSAGWIFMDYQNDLNDQNIIIYGHHRLDGSMFGSIDELFKNNNNSLNITLITNDKIFNYRIFSIYKISSFDSYNSRNFENFKKTIEEFSNRSIINYNNYNNYNDTKQIITLSTCHSNNIDRIVVHGYLL